MAGEKEQDKKNIEEKRVKATVIRRRAAKPVEPEPAPPTPAAAAPPPAAEAPPAVPVQPAAAETGGKAAAEAAGAGRPVKGKKGPVRAAAEAAVEKGAPEQAAPPAAVVEEKKGAAAVVEVPKKEVREFEKNTELKKFYTRYPAKKGKRFQAPPPGRKGAPAAQASRAAKKTEITVPKAAKRVVKIADAISVADFSQRIGVKAGEIIRKLMGLGVMATVNQLVDVDTAAIIAQDYDYEVENVAVAEETLIEGEGARTEGLLEHRAPVVTVMGHVDHGKTSLLDAIRETNVAVGEAGGITQHIGAYHVHLDRGDVTFLDTPGHEAFTAMRARGAKATDIVILVVAADDGVMPQTVEAINHAKAANVPIIVAINKIDLPQADPRRVKNELLQYGLVSEELGGQTIFMEVSAKKRIKIKELLEMILLQAEVLELKAARTSPARGIVVEAKLDKGRGPVATVLIQNGTLSVGDAFVTGVHHGRIRAMISDWGKRVNEAGPSMPIEILGLSGVPTAGDAFTVVKDEATAKQIATIRQRKLTEKERARTAKVSLADLYDKIEKGEVKGLNLVIKADVQGSIEAIKETLSKFSSEAIKLNIIHSAVGGIIEGDVMLAAASNAIVIGFNVRPEPKASALAEKEKVDVRLYTIIYNLADDIKNAMEGMLAPVVTEEASGRAEIREVFKVSKIGTVAGCYVTEGKASRQSRLRLVRDNVVIYDGKLSSLKRFKDDVREVAAGFECGMTIEGYNDVKVGDVIEFYVRKEEAAKL